MRRGTLSFLGRLLGRQRLPLRVKPLRGASGTIALKPTSREGRLVVRGGDVEFALPEGGHVYLTSSRRGDFAAPPGKSALALEPGARYRLRAQVALEGGQATLWLIEYDGRARVAHQTQPLQTGSLEWSWTTHARHAGCTLAIRLAGTGRLHVGELEVDPGAPAAAGHRIEVMGADPGAGAWPLYRFTASAGDPADDLDFAVNQLEVLWQAGLVRAIRIRAEDAPAPPVLLEWIGRRRIPVVLEGGASARAAWDALRQHEADRTSGPEREADLRFPALPRTAEDLAAQGFVIVEPGKLPAQESVQAKQFWSGYESRSWYRRHKPWARMLRELVEELRPESVLEFGCNVGRNLLALKGAVPGMRLVGIDINAEAIREGRQATGLDLRLGDETMLGGFADGEFDMVFTVSVLDHLAEAEPTCAALLRCARQWACFLEVRLPVEGKVLRHFDHKLGRVSDSTGASYSWHLERCLRGHPRVEQLQERPCYLHPASLGPYYHWYHATLRS